MSLDLATFECPGKIILLGEYSVMVGGPALVGTTKPMFSITAKRTDSAGLVHPFAAQSPAGLLIARMKEFYGEDLGGMSLTWSDPYDTPIGVGSSSAQFILSYQALHQLLSLPLSGDDQILEDYWEIVGTTQGLRPSGADIIAQLHGGVVLFRNEPFLCEPQSSEPFKASGAKFYLAYTGSKMRTHEHLMTLADRGFPSAFEGMLQAMSEITLSGLDAWQKSDAAEFGRSMNAYQNLMNRSSLSDEPVIQAITAARSWPGVLGAKGSGAQGGDCALFLIETGAESRLDERCREQGWRLFDVKF